MDRQLSVTQVNHFVRTLLEGNAVLKQLHVTGEISNFKHHVSGHLYFSLKDASSRIRCVMFKSQAGSLAFEPSEGMQVAVTGSLSVYEVAGEYQIIVRAMAPAGIGDLYRAFEDLKADLSRRGWFDQAAKQPLPQNIGRVGIVTSPVGAAVRDLISVIRRRNPGLRIILYPALVQGEGAPASVARGIEAFGEYEAADVLIVGRGGGSIEDLWAFNTRQVAEAIHFSPIPVISAVGHETDFTIADFTADFRAPTPSVAGEMVAMDRAALKVRLRGIGERLTAAFYRRMDQETRALAGLDDRLKAQNPQRQLVQERLLLAGLSARKSEALRRRIEEAKGRITACKNALILLDPKGLLNKGYALVTDTRGRLVSRAAQTQPDQRLILTLSDGRLEVEVKEKCEDHG
jgi:exodeoxyribonuclease VII large subunit